MLLDVPVLVLQWRLVLDVPVLALQWWLVLGVPVLALQWWLVLDVPVLALQWRLYSFAPAQLGRLDWPQRDLMLVSWRELLLLQTEL